MFLKKLQILSIKFSGFIKKRNFNLPLSKKLVKHWETWMKNKD